MPTEKASWLARREDARLIRRISGTDTSQHIVSDAKSPSGRRLSSSVFKPSSVKMGGGMSVDVLDLILLHYGDPASYLRQYPWIAAIEFSIGGLRGLGFTVQLDPVPANPCHAQVRGSFSRQQITQLSQAAKWFIEIPGVSITGC